MRETCLENTFISIRTMQWGADIWLKCGLISLKVSGCHVTTNILQQTNFFEEHLEFIKTDQKRHDPDSSTEKATYYRKTWPSWQVITSYNAEPFCQIALCKKKCNKVLTGGESISQLVFYKKLYVKDVKIKDVLKTKEEKDVGKVTQLQSH